VLVDTHWIGGDPNALAVYGHAAWSPRKGIIVLRNPSDKPQGFDLDVGEALELPPGAARTFGGQSPWAADAGARSAAVFSSGTPVHLELKPFEVRTIDLTPRPAPVK
jgi:hypothetical protein